MQPRSRVPQEPVGNSRSQPSLPSASPQRSELAAIALLCLVFAWPGEEPTPAHLRPVPE
jgi:hypothetical protein